MTTIRPFFRGYRQALRDVQHAAERYVKSLTVPQSIIGALNVATETSAIELMRLKMDRSPALRMVEKAEYTLRNDLQTCCGITSLTDLEAFGHGYRRGFDRALELMTGDAWRMNNPGARLAVFEVIMMLEKIRFEIASDEDGKIRTLRARSYLF
jgi:hypothetical protein